MIEESNIKRSEAASALEEGILYYYFTYSKNICHKISATFECLVS